MLVRGRATSKTQHAEGCKCVDSKLNVPSL